MTYDLRGAFLMPIEDIYSIAGRGIHVTGRVERGNVRLGDEVEIVGIRDTVKTSVNAIYVGKQELDSAEPGHPVMLGLREVAKDEVERGQILAKPGSLEAHQELGVEVRLPISQVHESLVGGGHRLEFWGVEREVVYDSGPIESDPDETSERQLGLDRTVGLERFQKFTVRKGDRTIGEGTILRFG